MPMNLTIPNVLTLIRLIFSPLVLPLLIITLYPLHQVWIHALLSTLFICFALTDFLDGMLARRWNQTSQFGALLDHTADKFLTCSTLIALLAIGRISAIWVLLLVGRELWVMGLRQAALENNLSVPVSGWGKLKTIAQMSYLAVVLAYPTVTFLEVALLATTLTLSLWSAFQYQKRLLAQLK